MDNNVPIAQYNFANHDVILLMRQGENPNDIKVTSYHDNASQPDLAGRIKKSSKSKLKKSKSIKKKDKKKDKKKKK